MKKRGKRVLLGLLVTAVLLVGGVFALVRLATYQPTNLAIEALTSSPEVQVDSKKELTIFKPVTTKSTQPAIIFYQGALVQETSYSYLATQLAANGYPVYLIHHPMNLPVLAMKAGDRVMDEFHLKQVVVGGHSLGGVVASRFAHRDVTSPDLKGVFFLASYPDEKGDLSSFKGGVLSITATNDQVLNWQSYEKSRSYLPKQTDYLSIEGGNHGGFGAYGQQKKDGQATLTTKEQQDQVVSELLAWLATL